MSTGGIRVTELLICFSPAKVSHINLIIRPARKTLKGRGKFFLPERWQARQEVDIFALSASLNSVCGVEWKLDMVS